MPGGEVGTEAVRADFDALRRHLGLEEVHAIGWSNGAITVPALVLAGAHDTIPLEKAEAMRDGLPDAKLVVFADSGHFAPLEEPERFREAVFGFLGVD